MKTKIDNLKTIALSILCLGLGLTLGGCAGGYVSTGYSGAYYAPDYSPYYGLYGYSGGPYYGYNPGYSRSFVIRGTQHRRYYGRHHFAQNVHRGSVHSNRRSTHSRRATAPSRRGTHHRP